MQLLSASVDGSPGIAATTWRRYEDPAIMVDVNPNANKLVAVARTIGADPAEVFDAAGMVAPRLPDTSPPPLASVELPEELSAIWRELDQGARARLLGYADGLRAHQAEPGPPR